MNEAIQPRNDMQVGATKAKYLIDNSAHMVIATADESGKPWVSPVFFAPDDENNLYWVSAKDARHSRNIRSRPQVGIVIFGPVPPEGKIDGLYIDADAEELHEAAEVKTAIGVLQQRPQDSKFMIDSPDDVSGKASWRIYKATPTEFTKRADATDPSSGQAITVRIPIDL